MMKKSSSCKMLFKCGGESFFFCKKVFNASDE